MKTLKYIAILALICCGQSMFAMDNARKIYFANAAYTLLVNTHSYMQYLQKVTSNPEYFEMDEDAIWTTIANLSVESIKLAVAIDEEIELLRNKVLENPQLRMSIADDIILLIGIKDSIANVTTNLARIALPSVSQ